jgi:hypothetical protein
MRLCGAVSEKCLVIGSSAYHRPGLLKDEEITPDFCSSGVVLCVENVTTVSDCIAAANKLEGEFFWKLSCLFFLICTFSAADHRVTFGVHNSDTFDSFAVDFVSAS